MSSLLRSLIDFGQSFWYDGLSREMLLEGELRRLVKEDGLRGVTSNPTIFQKAVSGSDRYDGTIQREGRAGKSPEGIFDVIAEEDIRGACDVLREVFDATGGADGFVSLEESPRIAHDTEASVREGHRLAELVDRPNLLVKVPATPEGIPAVRRLLTEGVNVNITLMFSLENYDEVAEAYIAALEQRAKEGLPLHPMASVASMFVSRIDTKVDGWIDEMAAKTDEQSRRSALLALRGKLAIANAKLCYRRYKRHFRSERFAILAKQGARPQRVLFASTSTKDPTYPDTYYIDNLVGQDTVTTMPLESVTAFRDHGKPAATLEEGVDAAQAAFDRAGELGIDITRAMNELQDEGVVRFADSYNDLLQDIAKERDRLLVSA